MPTSSLFIAQQIKKMIHKLLNENKGIYHLVPNGGCTWFDFAMAILNTLKPDQSKKKIIPVSSKQYPTRAIRPENSCLLNAKIRNAFMLELNDWKSVFLESFKNINE